jgi:hypothetical protein
MQRALIFVSSRLQENALHPTGGPLLPHGGTSPDQRPERQRHHMGVSAVGP